jgi:Mg/Co/Ni transporter MgtE
MLTLSPKLVIGSVAFALLAGGAWHYRHTLEKNTRLVIQVLQLQADKDALVRQVEDEKRAAAIAAAERAAAQRALNRLREERAADLDPEYLEWSRQRIPPSERARVCAATGAVGCE